MKLTEVSEKSNKGTYAGVKFTTATVNKLSKFIKDNNIPNGLKKDEFHTTLLYSRKHLPNYKPKGKITPKEHGTPTGLEIWPSQPDEKTKEVKNCLVLTYSCPYLHNRHHTLMNKHGAEYDFDEYKPHITLSYDVKDLNIDDITVKPFDIVLDNEYSEELNLCWTSDK